MTELYLRATYRHNSELYPTPCDTTDTFLWTTLHHFTKTLSHIIKQHITDAMLIHITLNLYSSSQHNRFPHLTEPYLYFTRRDVTLPIRCSPVHYDHHPHWASFNLTSTRLNWRNYAMTVHYWPLCDLTVTVHRNILPRFTETKLPTQNYTLAEHDQHACAIPILNQAIPTLTDAWQTLLYLTYSASTW